VRYLVTITETITYTKEYNSTDEESACWQASNDFGESPEAFEGDDYDFECEAIELIEKNF